MSYVVFALGLLLTAVGGLSIYDGYGIITLERGWSETIAGATLMTGGILTIALALILRRLKILCDLYAASSQPLAAPSSVAVEPRMVATAIPVAASPIAAPSPSTPPSPPAIAPANTGSLLDVPGVLRPAASRPAAPPPAQPFVRPSKPVYPEPEPAPARELAFASSAAAIEEPPVDEATIPERPRPSAAALSLDEMWKRVTEEIERPILSPEPEPASARAAELPEAKTEAISPKQQDLWESPAEEPVALAESQHVEEPEPINEPEAEPAEELEAPPAATPINELFMAEESMEAVHVGPAPAPPAIEAHPHHMPPPVEPPKADPAVIGRYEAEGTAYLMFDDGSIEAQSEAGVFRFASMADLKAFIEEKQAVEP